MQIRAMKGYYSSNREISAINVLFFGIISPATESVVLHNSYIRLATIRNLTWGIILCPPVFSSFISLIIMCQLFQTTILIATTFIPIRIYFLYSVFWCFCFIDIPTFLKQFFFIYSLNRKKNCRYKTILNIFV